MRGRWIEITPEAQLAISAWATMFTMVCEFADSKTQAITKRERHEFMRVKRPSDEFVVSFGFSATEERHGSFWHKGMGLYPPPSAGPDPDAVSRKCNTQTTTFGVGRLILHTYSSTSGTIVSPYEVADCTRLSLLWPGLVWPIWRPPVDISAARFDIIAEAVFNLVVRESRG
jgi:hypothetical protein